MQVYLLRGRNKKQYRDICNIAPDHTAEQKYVFHKASTHAEGRYINAGP